LVESYGLERADRMIRLTLKNYSRLAFINTGQYDIERYRAYTRRASERFGLRYEEIQGSNELGGMVSSLLPRRDESFATKISPHLHLRQAGMTISC